MKKNTQARVVSASGGRKVNGRGRPMHKSPKRKRVGRGGARQNNKNRK